MSDDNRISRRHFLRNTATASALGVVGHWPIGDAYAVDDLIIGFIYAGPRNDYGYNQAHAEGAAILRDIPGISVIEEENIPETAEVEESIETTIHLDGAALLFPTSFSYFDPYVVQMARKYPRLQFRHCGNLWRERHHPDNTGSYFGYIEECEYLSGIAAGLTSRSGKLGFIAAKPLSHVLRNINAFTLGARSVNSDITTRVIFTGAWSAPSHEVEAANALIDQGVDVMTYHVDSPRAIIDVTERRGVAVCGYHTSQAKLAPRGYLTGAEWNWATVYRQMVAAVRNDEPIPNFMRGGLREGFVRMSRYGTALDDSVARVVDAAKIAMLKGGGDNVIFKGPLSDNNGRQIIAAGQQYDRSHPRLAHMDWLVEGVIGPTG
jgi:simple sugar transport system substrate-binding protein